MTDFALYFSCFVVWFFAFLCFAGISSHSNENLNRKYRDDDGKEVPDAWHFLITLVVTGLFWAPIFWIITNAW